MSCRRTWLRLLSWLSRVRERGSPLAPAPVTVCRRSDPGSVAAVHREGICPFWPVAAWQLPQAGPDYPCDAKAPGRKEQHQSIAAPVGHPRREQGDEYHARQHRQEPAVVKGESSCPAPVKRELLRCQPRRVDDEARERPANQPPPASATRSQPSCQPGCPQHLPSVHRATVRPAERGGKRAASTPS